jgi:hypothetical protein
MATMEKYDGTEHRQRIRRESDVAQNVNLEHVSDGAAKFLQWCIRIGTGILLALLIGFPITWWRAGQWTRTIESAIISNGTSIKHNADDITLLRQDTADQDAALAGTLAATGDAVRETSETMREVVVEQRASRRDIEQLRTDVRDLRNQGTP